MRRARRPARSASPGVRHRCRVQADRPSSSSERSRKRLQSPAGTSIPAPSASSSGIPPTGVETTGMPCAIASISANGNALVLRCQGDRPDLARGIEREQLVMGYEAEEPNARSCTPRRPASSSSRSLGRVLASEPNLHSVERRSALINVAWPFLAISAPGHTHDSWPGRSMPAVLARRPPCGRRAPDQVVCRRRFGPHRHARRATETERTSADRSFLRNTLLARTS